MNAHTTINTALALRGMLPMDGHCVCACCDARGLHRDDMADPDTSLAKHFGGPVCHECEGNHVTCDKCDQPLNLDEAVDEGWDRVHADCSSVIAAQQHAEYLDEMRRDAQ